MKIVEEGKWKSHWKHQIVCQEKECETTLEIEESDVQVRGYKGRLRDNTFFVKCVVCGHEVSLKNVKIPLRVVETLDATLKVSTYYD